LVENPQTSAWLSPRDRVNTVSGMKVFQYPRCGTCRKALKWLDARGIEYAAIDIVESPPSLAQLKKAHKLSGLPVTKFFNTSGQAYRDGDYKARLAKMSDAQALQELATNGKLIKRPLVIGSDFVLVGFKEDAYQQRLA